MELKRTGRPRAWLALAAASAWMRGRPDRYGSTRTTPTIRAASAAAPMPSPTASRFTARLSRGLRGLDGRELPGVVADGARECPELLDALDSAPRALHHGARRIVDGVVEERGADVGGHVVAPALLPRLRDLRSLDANLLDVVCL